MALDVGAGAVDNPPKVELVECKNSAIQEPCVGMEFDSEDAAKEFYDAYARSVGFIMRIDQCRRSEVDRRILSRRLSCNKQGYYAKTKDQFGPSRKPRASTREGCKAMMLVKINKLGKWVVTRFTKDHTHPLVISSRPSRNPTDSKDRKIQELTVELQHQDQLCDHYREQLITLLENIEEQTDLLSSKIQLVVKNVKEFETEVQKPINH